jgi:histone-lysine N-methyltransferase SETD3
VYYPKLELKFFSDDHRGIYAKNKIQKDELVVKIPLNMLITLEMAKESPIGQKMVNANLDLYSPKHCYLATFLLQEISKKDSQWKLYLDILPKCNDNFPIFYTTEEKKWLSGSPFLSQINDKINDILMDYNMILAVAKEFEKFSLKEFSEMRMAVSSRIFGIRVCGKKTDCFAPLADMLNHKRPRQTQWFYSDELKSFVVQAIHDIEKNEQVKIFFKSKVYDSYGKKCNSRFLLNYGFIVDNNDGNEFPITLELNPSCPLYSYKLNLLKPSKEFKKTFRLPVNFNEEVVNEYFSFLRFLNYDEDINELINVSRI